LGTFSLVTGDTIQHAMIIEGVVTPAVIHNSSYFFIDLPVYANGLVDCWEMVDFPLFEEKLARGWVVTSVPDGKAMSIHRLGSWIVEEGRWSLDARGLHARVVELVRAMNPEMRNLHDCHGETTRKHGELSVSILGMSNKTPVRADPPSSAIARTLRGKSLSAWLREGDTTYLVSLRVFADGKIELGRIPEPRLVTLEDLQGWAKAGRLAASPPPGTRVAIHGFGSFAVGEAQWSVELDDLLREIPDLVDAVNGRPDSVARCRAAYEAYVGGPSEERRALLRSAYEQIPEHNRTYVGDMDTKDIPVRMIVYGDQELEAWSHRAVARHEGMEPLPTITVPKVPKRDEE
jgi:hypothetical protein